MLRTSTVSKNIKLSSNINTQKYYYSSKIITVQHIGNGFKKNRQAEELYENESFMRMLDRGIDDMEAGRELPLNDAFKKISELRDTSSQNQRIFLF